MRQASVYNKQAKKVNVNVRLFLNVKTEIKKYRNGSLPRKFN